MLRMSLETSSVSFMLSTDIGRNIELNMFHTGHCSKPQDTANLVLSKRSPRTFPHFTFAYVLQQVRDILHEQRSLQTFWKKPFSYNFGREKNGDLLTFFFS